MSRILGTLSRGGTLVSCANGARYQYNTTAKAIALLANLGQGERVRLAAWDNDHVVVIFVDAETHEVTFAEKFRVE